MLWTLFVGLVIIAACVVGVIISEQYQRRNK